MKPPICLDVRQTSYKSSVLRKIQMEYWVLLITHFHRH